MLSLNLPKSDTGLFAHWVPPSLKLPVLAEVVLPRCLHPDWLVGRSWEVPAALFSFFINLFGRTGHVFSPISGSCKLLSIKPRAEGDTFEVTGGMILVGVVQTLHWRAATCSIDHGP